MSGDAAERPQDSAEEIGNRLAGNSAGVFAAIGLGRVVGIRRSLWDKFGTNAAGEAYHGAAVVSRQPKCSDLWESGRTVDQRSVTV